MVKKSPKVHTIPRHGHVPQQFERPCPREDPLINKNGPYDPNNSKGGSRGARPTSLKLAPCVLQVNKPPSIPKTWQTVSLSLSLSDFYFLLLNPSTLSLDHCPFVVKETRYPQKRCTWGTFGFRIPCRSQKDAPTLKTLRRRKSSLHGMRKEYFQFLFF